MKDRGDNPSSDDLMVALATWAEENFGDGVEMVEVI